MGPSLEQLVETWHKSQDEDTTIALCEKLGDGGPRELIGEVGKNASIHHASNPDVLVAVGKMYLRTGRLGDAQGLLVAAGKLAPKGHEVYRWLGEVLLRRGDAERALKAFNRTAALGHSDDETQRWAARARELLPLQKQSGANAVAAELARSLEPGARAELTSEDLDGPTGVSHPVVVHEPPTMPRTPGPPPARVQPARPKAMSSDSEVTTIRKPPLIMDFVPEQPPPAHRPGPIRPPEESLFPEIRAVEEPAVARSAPPTPHTLAQPAPRTPPPPAPRTPPPPPMIVPLAPAPVLASQRPAPVSPQARQLVHALSQAGVLEPAGVAAAVWANAPRARARFVVRAILLTILVIGGIAGGFVHLRDKSRARHEQARGLRAQVEALLLIGTPNDLPAIDDKLSRAFDLEPGDPTTALLWLRERALRLMMRASEDDGIETAVARARAAGVSEDRIVFARIASYVVQNDFPSALALVSRWDSRAEGDPYFQLFSGAALERVGDTRAVERYRLAAKLAPDLVLARVLWARAVLLDIDLARGLELAAQIQKKWPDRAESAALVALAWERDPHRGPPPIEVAQSRTRKGELPVVLEAVPMIGVALEAIQSRSVPQARPALRTALASAGAPALASWIGTLALGVGDEHLARQAADEMVRACPLYPQGRVLAARLSLAAGRYDEAEQLVSVLDPTVLEVAMVKAILAYERSNPGSLSVALSPVPADLRLVPDLFAMSYGGAVTRGAPLDLSIAQRLATPAVPWGELVAIDAALDAGDLVTAADLLDRSPDAKTRPPYALRLARLLRYRDNPQEADGPSRIAVEALGTPSAILERLFVLLAVNKSDEARALAVRSAAALGPLHAWMLGYMDADGPYAREARKKLAGLNPPGDDAPFVFRTALAIVLSHVADRKRAFPIIRSLAQIAPKNPDVLFASQSLP